MINTSVLTLFIPTFLLVSATPGMCMTLAMTMGMTIGVRRTFWMMTGELLGVGLVAVAAVVGVAALMLNYPQAFELLRLGGGAYLGWLGIQMWCSRGRMAIPEQLGAARRASRTELALQGFVTAIANPKGWAFFIALLPPFISADLPLEPQLVLLVLIILTIEFLCLVLYASGGSTLRHLLQRRGNVRLMNRLAGSLMIGVGVWLAVG